MLYTYRKFPILERLRTGSMSNFKVLPEDANSFDFNQQALIEGLWKAHYKYFSKNIQNITAPFYETYCVSRMKILNDLRENFEGIEPTYGTFLIGDYTYCYYLRESEGITDCCVFFFRGETLGGFCYKKRGESFGWYSLYHPHVEENVSMQILYNSLFQEITCLINFLKYVEVETKFVGANRRSKYFNVKYVNQTDFDIRQLDSTYFTTLIKTEGFGVRGHFRLQPCGKEMKSRRLIWINDFQKHGYTREAKVLTNQE